MQTDLNGIINVVPEKIISHPVLHLIKEVSNWLEYFPGEGLFKKIRGHSPPH